jgi:Insertion element 4 transposase N-terminal
VLQETWSTEQRSRLLPARVVVDYVLAMCLFCEDAYEEVMRKLVNGLRFLGNWSDDCWRVPTTSAISQARQRLGEAPLAALFDRAVPLARPGTRGGWFNGHCDVGTAVGSQGQTCCTWLRRSPKVLAA